MNKFLVIFFLVSVVSLTESKALISLSHELECSCYDRFDLGCCPINPNKEIPTLSPNDHYRIRLNLLTRTLEEVMNQELVQLAKPLLESFAQNPKIGLEFREKYKNNFGHNKDVDWFFKALTLYV